MAHGLQLSQLSAFGFSSSRRCGRKARFKLSSSSIRLYSQPPLVRSTSMFRHDFSQGVAAIVLGDGSEAGLYPLTRRRSEAALPIAANFRLVDAVVSNCINSNIHKIYALTQFNSASLNSHLSRAYAGKVGNMPDGSLQVIAACQSPEYHTWFQGGADAVRRCLWILDEQPVTEFLLLPGHHLYKMDYRNVVEAHRKSNAHITIVASPATRNDHHPAFGFLQVASGNLVTGIIPSTSNNPKQSTAMTIPILQQGNGNGKKMNLSMGIYVIERDTMVDLLKQHFPTANDFASEVIPAAISMGRKVESFVFHGYWEDMRSIQAFYEANMACTKKETNPFLTYNFYDTNSPIYTLPRLLPPTIVSNALITDSIIGDGCILNRCEIRGSVIGMRTRIGDGAVVEESVIMGSDTYQAGDGKRSEVPEGIGDNTCIRRAIVDKNAKIGKNVKIINRYKVEEGDGGGNDCVISGGVVVIPRAALIPDNAVI